MARSDRSVGSLRRRTSSGARRSPGGLTAGLLCLAAAGATAGAATAAAGPEWEERIGGDAGSLPASAEPVGKIGGGPLDAIRGELTGFGILGGDFQDMFLIEIVDPAGFIAQVNFPDGVGFDTQLFLFQAESPFVGFGFLANDEVGGGPPGPSQLLPNSDDGSGFQIVSPGFYLLAISGADSDPVSVGGEIFAMPPGATEISGADGPGATAGPVNGWTTAGDVGAYRILLQGCTLINFDPPCPGDFNRDGMIGFDDLVAVLAAWGPCPSCPFDLDGDFEVGFSDLLVILESWGPCPK